MPPAPPAAGTESPDSDVIAARQQRAAERLVEDERLRGDLTDEEFGPLLDWALATIDRVAAETVGQPDDVADGQVMASVAAIREALALVNDRAKAIGAPDAPAERSAVLHDLISQITRCGDAEEAVLVARGPAGCEAGPMHADWPS